MIHSFVLTHVKKIHKKVCNAHALAIRHGFCFVLNVVIFLDVFVCFLWILFILHTQYFINNTCGWVKA